MILQKSEKTAEKTRKTQEEKIRKFDFKADLNFTYKSAIMPECGLTMYGVTKYQRVTVVTKVTIKNFDKIVLLMMTVD